MASVAKRTWTHKGQEKTAWVVRYRDGDAQPSRQFKLKRDADKFAREVENEIESGDHVSRSHSKTVGAFLDEYVALSERRVEDKTFGRTSLRLLRNALELHLTPALRGKLLIDLTAADMDTWLSGMRNLRSGRQLALVSRRRIAGALTVALDFAVKRGYARKNVLRQVAAEHLGGRKQVVRTFTTEQIERLLKAVEVRPDRNTRRSFEQLRLMVYLALYCGLRHGEIQGLMWKNVDLERRLIHVRHSLTDLDELKGPKTEAGVRDVPMPPLVVAQFRTWAAYVVEEPRGLIVRSRSGELARNSIFYNSLWRPVLRRAGLGPDKDGRAFRFHSLRHYYASQLIEGGVGLMRVASLMGHSKFDMTLQVYAHTIAGGDADHSAIDRIAERLSGPTSTAIAEPAAPTDADRQSVNRAARIARRKAECATGAHGALTA